MALPKEMVQGYTRKLYKFLGDGHYIKLRKLRILRGFIETDDNPTELVLDYRDKLVPTLLHEFLHYQHPDWSETRILKMESELVNSLTIRQVRNIIKRFADVI